MGRNTKIVATYGPAVASEPRLAELIRAGVDVIRLNFSHGDHDSHAAAVRQIRSVAAAAGKPVAILQDLRGPKIRVGMLPLGKVELVTGARVTLFALPADSEETAGRPGRVLEAGMVPVEGYPTLSEDVHPGEQILLDDGAIALRVREIVAHGVICEIETGGTLSSRKGVNFPESKLKTIPSLTEKDRRDLEFGVSQGVDWLALSFVRRAQDIRDLKEQVRALRADVPVIAKIEKGEALRDLEAIVDEAAGVMVARGDLGVETNLSEVVLRQKEIIRECNRRGRVVITATQMLESMMQNPRPTRAEVADVSNAVFDGTDALMLSGETAVGKYPVRAVAFMADAAERVEESLDFEHLLSRRPYLSGVPDAVAHAACMTAHEIDAQAMICLTISGLTATLVSRYRPKSPVVAVSPLEETVRRLMLHWGVVPLHLDSGYRDGPDLVDAALDLARARGCVREGDKVVITAGVSTGALRGKTNLIRVEVM